MPRAYSDDLRRKLLEAYETGAGSLRELATRFRVSWGYSKKIRGQQLRTGQKARPVQAQHGPVSRVTATVQQQLRAALRQQPDLTLGELQQRMQQATGVRLSKSLVWLWLRRLGLARKKNPSMPRSRTAGKTSGAGKAGGNR
jgi:transposase